MITAVNVKEIYNHLDVLRREKREVDVLIEKFTVLMHRNTETAVFDPNLIYRHLQIAQGEAANIQRRIDCLESAAEEFQTLTQAMDNIFADARNLAAFHATE